MFNIKYRGLSIEDRNELNNSLAFLYSNFVISNFLNPLDGKIISFTNIDHYNAGPLNASYYYPEVWASISQGSFDTDPGEMGIYIGDYDQDFTLPARSINGSTFFMDFGRSIFHELAHATLTPTYSDLAAWVSNGQNYFEELAVFAENAIYARAFGGPERMGHSSTATGVSVSATKYLQAFSAPSFESSEKKMRVTVTNEDRSPSGRVVKDYYKPGFSIDLMRSDGSTSHNEYDHYISIQRSRALPLLNRQGGLADITTASILDSSAAGSTAAAWTTVSAVFESSNKLIAELTAHYGTNALPPVVGSLIAPGTSSPPKFLTSISAERFADAKDVSGPVVKGGVSGPVSLAIRAESDEGTIVFGGGGYEKYRVSLQNTRDDLAGKGGDDILLGALAIGSNASRSYLDGSAGKDLIISRGGYSVLLGGAGDDVIVAGARADMINGGDGNDAVSYIASTSAVTFSQGVATGGAYASGDTLENVEILIGSNFDDTLEGATKGMVLVGGDGDDTLIGHAGDILIGGDGSDEYQLFSNEMIRLYDNGVNVADPAHYSAAHYTIFTTYSFQTTNIYGLSNAELASDVMNKKVYDMWALPLVSIVGLNSEDKVFVDGSLITGRQVNYDENSDFESGSFSWMNPFYGEHNETGSVYQNDAPYRKGIDRETTYTLTRDHTAFDQEDYTYNPTDNPLDFMAFQRGSYDYQRQGTGPSSYTYDHEFAAYLWVSVVGATPGAAGIVVADIFPMI